MENKRRRINGEDIIELLIHQNLPFTNEIYCRTNKSIYEKKGNKKDVFLP